MLMDYFYNWQEHARSKPDKLYKTTLCQGEHMMVGLNCLEPGQTQSVHAHESADKFYFVLEGSGTFTVGDDERQADAGTVVAAPAGIRHGVTNSGNERLSLLVAIAPPPIK
jgi:quercetin dioxygenase-like cupin family protein